MMKRASAVLTLCALLALCLTACGMGTADNNTAGNDTTGSTVGDSAKSRTRTMSDVGSEMMSDGRYFAAANGRVRGSGTDSLSQGIRSAADDMLDGMRRAGDDMSDGMRRAGDDIGQAVKDMTGK